MKIAHIGPKNYPPSHGGVEKVVFDLIQNIKNILFYVIVEWPQPESKTVKVLPKGLFNQVSFIWKYIKENRITIVHFHKETFVPHALLIRIFFKRVILTVHGCAWRINRWSWYYRVVFYFLDLLACIFLPKVVFVGKRDYEHFSKIIFWKKLYYIPNGINLHQISTREDSSDGVFLGRISPEKNILNLIKMIGNANQKLTIYGPFDKHNQKYEEEVRNEICKYTTVTYGGVIESSNVLTTLSKYNTFYNISFSEGMPVSVLEAASVGLNLILSDIPAHKDLNFPDVTFVNPLNPKIDKAEKRIPSESNQKHAERNFSIKGQVDMYINIYAHI